jgi:hypothetical protein
MLSTKNATASHLVALERKLEEPRAPKTVPDAPEPKPERQRRRPSEEARKGVRLVTGCGYDEIQ